MSGIEWVVPDWPAPASVRAMATTRRGGVSEGVFSSLNLACHVGDSRDRVQRNRERLVREAGLPGDPVWLEQVHSADVVDVGKAAPDRPADAAVCNRVGRVCVVMTADCLPILLCRKDGGQVAAVHAGWRGLLSGIVDRTMARLDQSGSQWLAWLGPAISPACYQVDDELRTRFVSRDAGHASCFSDDGPGHWRADLYAIATRMLERHGVVVYGGNFCTYTDVRRFFSYRRDGECGRQASLIWMQHP